MWDKAWEVIMKSLCLKIAQVGAESIDPRHAPQKLSNEIIKHVYLLY